MIEARNLKNLEIEEEYRTDSCNIIDEFYLPCLSVTRVYSRASGYFSSDSLALTSKGLISLIQNGGKMRLIASPDLSIEDIEAINRGLKSKKDIIIETCKLELNEFDPVACCRLAFLEKLISSNLLEVKLALRINPNSKYGIYHEKIGIFEDHEGNYVSFTGSNNETKGGLENNFESCNVFCSWDNGVARRAQKKLAHFNELWSNKCSGLEVIDFTEHTARELLKFKKFYNEKDPESAIGYISNTLLTHGQNKPVMPSDSIFKLRDYQSEAIKNWFEANGKGIFEMCTGAGKTKTAISALTLAYKGLSNNLFVLIVAPYKHLVSQWTKELKEFNIDALELMGVSKEWVPKVKQKIIDYNSDVTNFVCLITTNQSFGTQKFKNLINKVEGNFLFVADEAHNLGSQNTIRYLPSNANLRIGLTATPIRHHDEEGTNGLFEYFGKSVIQFNLEEALDRGFLTRYFYHVVPVYMTKEESQEYESLSTSIERLSLELKSANKGDIDKNGLLDSLLFKRARLVASAQNKIPELKRIIQKECKQVSSALFYCGDGSLVNKTTNLEERQIEVVTKMLGEELGLKVHKFTAEEKLAERKMITEMFVKNELDGLIAIRCLDEGVDIPKIKMAFILASTTNPKQFIQRRGRVLRKFEGKDHAIIYDFLVLPVEDSVKYSYSKSLIARELDRINEFAKLAINGPECVGKLRQLKNKYNLMDK